MLERVCFFRNAMRASKVACVGVDRVY